MTICRERKEKHAERRISMEQKLYSQRLVPVLPLTNKNSLTKPTVWNVNGGLWERRECREKLVLQVVLQTLETKEPYLMLVYSFKFLTQCLTQSRSLVNICDWNQLFPGHECEYGYEWELILLSGLFPDWRSWRRFWSLVKHITDTW